jgi:hypothetical protein
MKNFYKISKELADLIGYFEYKKGLAIDAKVGEQKDGSYLIEEGFLANLKKIYSELEEGNPYKEILLKVMNNVTDIEKCEKVDQTKAKADLKEVEIIAKPK